MMKSETRKLKAQIKRDTKHLKKKKKIKKSHTPHTQKSHRHTFRAISLEKALKYNLLNENDIVYSYSCNIKICEKHLISRCKQKFAQRTTV